MDHFSFVKKVEISNSLHLIIKCNEKQMTAMTKIITTGRKHENTFITSYLLLYLNPHANTLTIFRMKKKHPCKVLGI